MMQMHGKNIFTVSGKLLWAGAMVAGGALAATTETISADDTQVWQAKTVAEVKSSLEKSDNKTYTIEYGDTIWAISQVLGVSVEDLANRNGLMNAELIIAGKTLVLNGPAVKQIEEKLVLPPVNNTTPAPEGLAPEVVAPVEDAVSDNSTPAPVAPEQALPEANADVPAPAPVEPAQPMPEATDDATVAPTPAPNQADEPVKPNLNQGTQTELEVKEEVVEVLPETPVVPEVPLVTEQPAPIVPETPKVTEKPKMIFGDVRSAGIAGYYNGGYSYPAYQCTGFIANILAMQGKSNFQYLGNGGQWAASAAARGFRVDFQPEVGAVASFQGGAAWGGVFGHVGYITEVYGDGSFKMIEGNFNGQPINERIVSVGTAPITGIIHF